jgi:hypothetical protein
MKRVYLNSFILTVSLGLSVALAGCASSPTFEQTALPNTGGTPGGPTNNPGGGSTTPGGTIPEACLTGDPLQQVTAFSPASTRAANVAMIIDDSGSMSDNINRVVNQVETFIDTLSSATLDHFKLLLIYDQTKLPELPALTNLALQHPNVFYHQAETWSFLSDRAVFKTLGSSSFVQSFSASDPNPVDFITNLNAAQSNCVGEGKYFRPRNNYSRNQESMVNFTCVSTTGNAQASTYFTPGTSVNFVEFSDDDLHIASVPSVLQMYQDVVHALAGNVPVYYHSVVGTQSACPFASCGSDTIDSVGAQHMTLSAMTGGRVEDIRAADYTSIFNNLTESILFSEQVLNLTCSFRAGMSVSVSFDRHDGNGYTLVDPSNYVLLQAEHAIRFLPSAFVSSDIGRSISARVTY